MWYLKYSKWVENDEFMPNCSNCLIPWRTIAKHSGQRTVEEECLYFVDKLEQLYGVLYNWVGVEKVLGGYRVIHPKRDSTLVIDYLIVIFYD